MSLASRPLLVIDGDNLAHRAYHSMPKTVRGRNGRVINAVVGWTNMMLWIWEQQHPRAIFTAWDTLAVPTYRHKLWPEYQAGRVFEPEILDQLEILPLLAGAFGFGVGKAAGYEADDLIAAAVLEETRQGGTSLILTNDKDSFQLVSESVTVLTPRKSISDLTPVDAAEVVARLGVLPTQVPDFKALAGDSSDNIPGASGIGPKSAAALLKRYGTLEVVLEAGAIKGGDAAFSRLLMFREMVRMQPDVPVLLPVSGPPRWNRASEFLAELGAEALSQRLSQKSAAEQGSLGL